MKSPTLPLLILVLLACASLFFANARGITGRFGVINDTQGAGNVSYSAVLRDTRSKIDYPIYDLADQDGKPLGIGFASGNGFCLANDLRSVSK